jgi:hypothetical protein
LVGATFAAMRRVTETPFALRPLDEVAAPSKAVAGSGLRARWQELDLLRPIEVARKLGYRTAEPVYDAIRRRELEPHIRRDGAYLIPISEALRYIESLRTTVPVAADLQRPTRERRSRSRRRTERIQLAPTRIER